MHVMPLVQLLVGWKFMVSGIAIASPCWPFKTKAAGAWTSEMVMSVNTRSVLTLTVKVHGADAADTVTVVGTVFTGYVNIVTGMIVVVAVPLSGTNPGLEQPAKVLALTTVVVLQGAYGGVPVAVSTGIEHSRRGTLLPTRGPDMLMSLAMQLGSSVVQAVHAASGRQYFPVAQPAPIPSTHVDGCPTWHAPKRAVARQVVFASTTPGS